MISSSILLLLLVAFISIGHVEAKMVNGEAQLSSIDTELYLTKFAADKGAQMQLGINMRVPQSFLSAGKHKLRIDVFTEEGFGTFKTMLAKGSLCDDRAKNAFTSIPVEVNHGRDGFILQQELTNEGKAQVFYLYLTDCALEFYNAKNLPPLTYDLSIKTEHLGHIPEDEKGLLTFNLLAALVLSALYVHLIKKCVETYARHKQIHIFVLMVVAAYSLQILALSCESLHLVVYNWNGKGLRWRHTFFALDFVSEIAQGMSEHLVALMLVFLACGWTTVNLHDLVQSVSTTIQKQPPAAAGVQNKDFDLKTVCLQFANTLLQNPKVKRFAKNLARQLSSPAKNMFRKVSLGSVFVLSLSFVTLVLEMMGRKYHDEFSQFHDHEHWPGKCILVLRVVLWVIFIFGAYTTYSGCKGELRASMVNVALFGSVWLLAFPLSVVIADMLPPRLRHRVVEVGSVGLQIVALQYLVFLCFFSKSFTKFSSIADPKKGSTLPDKITSLNDGNAKTGQQAHRRKVFKVAYD
jgi:hypothetical protein